MSRASDFLNYRSLGDGNLPLRDLTPVPLTAADTTLNSGVGPWVRNPGRTGGIHIELSDSVSPTATAVVEYSNTQTAKGAITGDPVVLSGAGAGAGVPCFNGFLWCRVRLTDITGASAFVTATLGIGE